MALYRKNDSSHQETKKSKPNGIGRLRARCRILEELWLYALNPSGTQLSPEAGRTLRLLAIQRGMPPDYFFSGFQSFNINNINNTNSELLKLYRHFSNRIWEYNEKMFLDWWWHWLRFYLRHFLRRKQILLNRKRKKGWLELNWEHMIWEEEHDSYLLPTDASYETLWLAGLNKIKFVYEQLTPALQAALPSQKDSELKWEKLYTHYLTLNVFKEKIQSLLAEHLDSSLEHLPEDISIKFFELLKKEREEGLKPLLAYMREDMLRPFPSRPESAVRTLPVPMLEPDKQDKGGEQ